jgi:hypothetical protein
MLRGRGRSPDSVAPCHAPGLRARAGRPACAGDLATARSRRCGRHHVRAASDTLTRRCVRDVPGRLVSHTVGPTSAVAVVARGLSVMDAAGELARCSTWTAQRDGGRGLNASCLQCAGAFDCGMYTLRSLESREGTATARRRQGAIRGRPARLAVREAHRWSRGARMQHAWIQYRSVAWDRRQDRSRWRATARVRHQQRASCAVLRGGRWPRPGRARRLCSIPAIARRTTPRDGGGTHTVLARRAPATTRRAGCTLRRLLLSYLQRDARGGSSPSRTAPRTRDTAPASRAPTGGAPT